MNMHWLGWLLCGLWWLVLGFLLFFAFYSCAPPPQTTYHCVNTCTAVVANDGKELALTRCLESCVASIQCLNEEVEK